MQLRIPFNGNWFYKPSFDSAVDPQCAPDVQAFIPVELPHTNRMLPLNGFDERESQFISCYKKLFDLPPGPEDSQLFLDFEGVMLACRVFLNGHLVGGHQGGYTPFSLDLTPYLLKHHNVLVVEVDSTECEDIPPFGGVVDYLTYGGIYREASLRMVHGTWIQGLRLSCQNPCDPAPLLLCQCQLSSQRDTPCTLLCQLFDPEHQPVASITHQVSLSQGSCWISLSLACSNLRLWSVEEPVLYQVRVTLSAQGDTDVFHQSYGFRSARFTPDGFYLNGVRRTLIGLNRHQSYPYVGYAMPKRIQQRDAFLIRKELGCQVVRTSHYPQSRHFLDACDQLGLLVIEEIPGWQHIGNASWKQHALQDLQDMIARDFNHPSIILWGVRINESQDDHDFYTQTNQIAHELDPTRQTGGVRYIPHSEFLEDVYTYNDFTHTGDHAIFASQKEVTGLDHPVPLLVTESLGHMYPTKSYDHESRSVEQAMRHLRVMDEALGREDLSGALSWCAFDYNTHASFGSGDKVCYHGVYDMFRNPKFSAYAYQCQGDPRDQLFLHPITHASRGEHDGGGTVPFVVLTNCDFIRVFRNGEVVGDFYPDHTTFPHLSHPPITVTHLMPQNLPFGLPQPQGEQLREFFIRHMEEGDLIQLSPQDFSYLETLAEHSPYCASQLHSMAVRAAGGWGEASNEILLEGYFQGERAISQIIGEDKYYNCLSVCPDDTLLFSQEETYDVTRIAITAQDQLGGRMIYLQECVQVHLEGPARLLGPAVFPLSGGAGACWIATSGQPGTVHVHVQGTRFHGSCTITVE